MPEVPDVFERLHALLTASNIPFTHTSHRAVFTSQEAAEVRGCPLNSGAKALVIKAGDAFFMIVLPADLALDSGATRRLLGSKQIRFASREEVLSITGLTPGSIPPFGSLFGLSTVCDERLAANEFINFNAGRHTDSFQMKYEDWLRHEAPRLARVGRSAIDQS